MRNIKKKPSEIFSILINILNNLDLEKKYTINEISKKSGLHWQTTNEYIKILKHIQLFSPKINVQDNEKIQVVNFSEKFKDIPISQRILVTLYDNKAFNEASSIEIEKIIDESDISYFLSDLLSKEHILKATKENRYFISKKGKINVISFYSNQTKDIFNIYNSSEEPFDEPGIYDIMNDIKEQNKLILYFLTKSMLGTTEKPQLKPQFEQEMFFSVGYKAGYKISSDSDIYEGNEFPEKYAEFLKKKLKLENIELETR